MGTIKTEQSLDSELYLNSSYEKATGCLSTGWQVLVEARGIVLHLNPLKFKAFRSSKGPLSSKVSSRP